MSTSSRSTEVPLKLGSILPNPDPVSISQDLFKTLQPIKTQHFSTTVKENDDQSTTTDKSQVARNVFAAPSASAKVLIEVNAFATPLQIWEGVVGEVNHDAGTMQVILVDKSGQMPRHTADIDLEWVTDQDRDLVKNGAVFYLTLFKRTKPSVENAQELRFRRRPAWSVQQIKEIERDASRIAAKIKAAPVAE